MSFKHLILKLLMLTFKTLWVSYWGSDQLWGITTYNLRGALNLRDRGQLNLLVRKNYTKFPGLCVFMFHSLHRTGLKSLEMATCHFISAESFWQNDSTPAMWCVSKNRNKHAHWFMAWKSRYWKLNCYKLYFNLKSNRTDMKKLW